MMRRHHTLQLALDRCTRSKSLGAAVTALSEQATVLDTPLVGTQQAQCRGTARDRVCCWDCFCQGAATFMMATLHCGRPWVEVIATRAVSSQAMPSSGCDASPGDNMVPAMWRARPTILLDAQRRLNLKTALSCFAKLALS